jgi:hypothetical protein
VASSGLQKAQVLKRNLPPLSVFDDGSIGHYVRYRIISEDRNKLSHWSPVYAVKSPDVSPVDGTLSYVDGVLRLVWDDEEDRPAYDIFVEWGGEIDKAQYTSTSIIIEMKHEVLFVVGEDIVISGITGTFAGINGTRTVTNVSGKLVTMAKPSGIGIESLSPVDGQAFRETHSYHGTSTTHTTIRS